MATETRGQRETHKKVGENADQGYRDTRTGRRTKRGRTQNTGEDIDGHRGTRTDHSRQAKRFSKSKESRKTQKDRRSYRWPTQTHENILQATNKRRDREMTHTRREENRRDKYSKRQIKKEI